MLTFALIAFVCQLVVGSKIVREKLIIIKNLGVQMECHTLGGSVKKRFIDIGRVRDIIINEVLTA